MFEKIIYVNVGADRASVKQNSQGIWYCNELTINDKHIDDCIRGIDTSIGMMNEVLNSYNKKKRLEISHKSLK